MPGLYRSIVIHPDVRLWRKPPFINLGKWTRLHAGSGSFSIQTQKFNLADNGYICRDCLNKRI